MSTSKGTLPPGWKVQPLKDLVEVLDSMRVPVNSKQRSERVGIVPYYGATGQVGTIDKTLFDEDLVLLGEDGVQFFDPNKQKAYEITGPAWVNNHAHVLRVRSDRFERRLLTHYLNQFDYRGYANGTTRLKLTQAAMRQIPVTVPPIAEQRRIVEVLEEQLSRVDAILASVYAVREGAAQFRRSLLHAAFAGSLTGHDATTWRTLALDEVAEVRLGRQRSPSHHSGDTMRPYLRAANVTWAGLDLTDVKEMNFTATEMQTFRLEPGDILVNEASGSPREVGKAAIFQGEIQDCAFQNTLLRVRPSSSTGSRYLHLFLTYLALTGAHLDDARGVGIAHLGRAKLAARSTPVPPIDEQHRIVDVVEEHLTHVQAELRVADRLERQCAALRRSFLNEAFTGKLTETWREGTRA